MTEFCEQGSLKDFLPKEFRPKYFIDISSSSASSIRTGLENVNPPSMSKNLQQLFPLDLNDTYTLLHWCWEIANGMSFLHSVNILHVDLALRNLLLTGTRQIKIADYGLSKQCVDSNNLAKSWSEVIAL